MREGSANVKRGQMVVGGAGIMALVVASAFVGAYSLGYLKPRATEILWQSPSDIQACAGPYSAQAVGMGDFPGGSGCSQTWFVFVPASEGGDVPAQTAFFFAHRSAFKGAILDDFQYSRSSLPSVFENLTSREIPVCTVQYAFMIQPSETVGSNCVIVGIRPGEQLGSEGVQVQGPVVESLTTWHAIISADLAKFNATNKEILVYEGSTSFWSLPIPANYTLAAQQISQMDNQPLVVWH